MNQRQIEAEISRLTGDAKAIRGAIREANQEPEVTPWEDDPTPSSHSKPECRLPGVEAKTAVAIPLEVVEAEDDGPGAQDACAEEPLKNPRHEWFCQHRASGKTLIIAYTLSGYSPDSGHAARLAANSVIKSRITAIQRQAGKAKQVDKSAALTILTEMANDMEARYGDRIAALKLAGQWCGWETGTEAERGSAMAAVSIADQLSAIRRQGR